MDRIGERMQREELIHALKSVLPGVSKEPGAYDTFLFDDTYIRTWNDRVSISFPLESGVQCCVKAKELFQIVNKMKGDIVKVNLRTGKPIDGKDDPDHTVSGTLIVKDEKTTLKMAVLQDASIREHLADLMDDLRDITWLKCPESFRNGLSLCSLSVDRDPHSVINGLALQGNLMLTCDNFRVSRFELEDSLFEDCILIPAKVLPDLQSYLDQNENIEIGRFGSWLHFKAASGVIFSCCLSGEVFPWMETEDIILGYDREGATEYEFPAELEESLDRAEILAEELGLVKYVQVYKRGQRLIVKGEREIGEVIDYASPNAKTVPDGLHLRVSAKFLKDILTITHKFWYNTKGNRSLVLFDTGSFSHLVSTRDTGSDEE
jgi:hypothetical protein